MKNVSRQSHKYISSNPLVTPPEETLTPPHTLAPLPPPKFLWRHTRGYSLEYLHARVLGHNIGWFFCSSGETTVSFNFRHGTVIFVLLVLGYWSGSSAAAPVNYRPFQLLLLLRRRRLGLT